MQVIVSDIDGTVVDVRGRIEAVLGELGVPSRGDPIRVADTLDRRLRSGFYRLFLSEKYTHLDAPVPEIAAALQELQARTALPLVMLSGRPAAMKRSTQRALDSLAMDVKEVILRPRSQSMQRTTLFKVEALRGRGYEPRYIFDDDPEILAALAEAFPDAELILVRGPQTTPWPE